MSGVDPRAEPVRQALAEAVAYSGHVGTWTYRMSPIGLAKRILSRLDEQFPVPADAVGEDRDYQYWERRADAAEVRVRELEASMDRLRNAAQMAHRYAEKRRAQAERRSEELEARLAGGGAVGEDRPPVIQIVEWLRGDEAEAIRAQAIAEEWPPEDALAEAIESRRWSGGGAVEAQDRPGEGGWRCPTCKVMMQNRPPGAVEASREDRQGEENFNVLARRHRALLAERDRLREALERIANAAELQLGFVAMREIATAALAGSVSDKDRPLNGSKLACQVTEGCTLMGPHMGPCRSVGDNPEERS